MEKQNLPHDHHSAMEKDFDHMPAPEAFEVTADLFKLMSDLTRVRLFWLLCRDGKEVYYRAADNVQANALHHVIEHVAEIACPE